MNLLEAIRYCSSNIPSTKNIYVYYKEINNVPFKLSAQVLRSNYVWKRKPLFLKVIGSVLKEDIAKIEIFFLVTFHILLKLDAKLK